MQNTKDVVSYFWPVDLLNPGIDHHFVVVGYKINKKYVVIDYVRYSNFKKLNLKITKNDLSLDIIGTLNFHHMNYRLFKFDNERHKPILESNENLIFFKPPKSKKLEYYSIDPISIDIFWTNGSGELVSEKYGYSNKLSMHFPNKAKVEDLKEVLKFINLTNYSRFKLLNGYRNQSSIYSNTVNHVTASITSIASQLYALTVQNFCRFMISILNYPLWFNPSTGERLTLCTLSFLLHQLNFRFKQFYNLPNQFQKLKNSRIETETLIIKGTRFSPSEYIKFYNTLWLILNDLLLGLIVSNFLTRCHNDLVNGINLFIAQFETFLNHLIVWLMNSPAGFKLNNELSEFFGELFMWVLDFWSEFVLKNLVSNTSLILKSISVLVKFGGLNILIAALIDSHNLITFHLHCFYFACTRVFNWQSHILLSLFRLFYGKKYNILRNRIDSNNYEFDQLLFGIIIFTLLLYLMPTVIAFYLNFAAGQLLGLLFCVTLQVVLVTFNHLPIVVLLLRLKNKERLPGGIILETEVNDQQEYSFRLVTKSLSLQEIFKSHAKALVNFNRINLTEYYGERATKRISASDIVDNWKRVSPLNLARKILVGELINNFDYRKMF